MSEEVSAITRKVVETVKKSRYHRAINSIALFGSLASDQMTPESDIDLLLDYDQKQKFSLLDLVGLQQEFEQALGKKVDLVTRDGLSPFLRAEILTSAKIVYKK